MASSEEDLNDLNNLTLDEEEVPSPSFHLFPSLPRELQVFVFKHVCAPTDDRHNEGGDGFVHYLDYWHSGRRSYTSLYSTLMNQCADARSHSHPGRKALLRTCRLARETSLLAWRKDIMTSSIPDWAGLEDQLKIRDELTWQVDFQLAKTRRTPPPSFPKFLELPFDLQYHVWRMTAASESIAKEHDMPKLLDDLVRQRVHDRPLKMPGWYYNYLDGGNATDAFLRPSTDPYFSRARAGLLKACRVSRLAALVEFKRDVEGVDRTQLIYGGHAGMDRMGRELDEKIVELRQVMDASPVSNVARYYKAGVFAVS